MTGRFQGILVLTLLIAFWGACWVLYERPAPFDSLPLLGAAAVVACVGFGFIFRGLLRLLRELMTVYPRDRDE